MPRRMAGCHVPAAVFRKDGGVALATRFPPRERLVYQPQLINPGFFRPRTTAN